MCRAYLEHGMHKLPQPVKLWYLGPYFRHERPQAGRYRQFWQVGAEAIGSDDPSVDAEIIVLLHALLGELGTRELRLRIASLGTPASRAGYRELLQAYLREHADRLSEETRGRIDLNPLRAFDAKDPGTQRVMEGAPRLADHLDDEDRAHFDAVTELLSRAGVEWELDDRLVRGLDYYTRTIFEFTSEALGAQSGVGGGGRYDGLIEQLGGPPTPGVRLRGRGRANADGRRGAPAAQARLRPVPRMGAHRARRRIRAGDRGAPRGARRAARPRRALDQGADEAGRSGGRSIRCDPLSGRDGAARHGFRAGGEGRAPGRRGRRAEGAPRAVRQPPRANDYRDAWCGELTADRAGTPAKVAGWVHRRRDHGGLIFIDLRDRSGIVQLVFHPQTSGDAFAKAERLRSEHVVAASGEVVRREEGNVNPNLATGEIELAVTEMELLAESETPPFPLDDDSVEVDEMLRLKLPRPGPAPRVDAGRHGAAPPDRQDDARRAGRA